MTEETKEKLVLTIKTAISFAMVFAIAVFTVIALQPRSGPEFAVIFGIVWAFIMGAIIWGL